MEKQIHKEQKADLISIISSATQIPGVKVSRNDFLRKQFESLSSDKIDEITLKGPVEAGCSRSDLKKRADKIIKSYTALSTSASFLAGLPGGIAMAATIPADLLQFYGVALRMAQELVYLYGESDLWCHSTDDGDKVNNQFILYCGVMLGASGAAQAVRVMSAKLAQQILTRLPKQALTKTFYYPVIKSILRWFGVSLSKSSFAKGLAKAVPVVGGVISGGITLGSMLPMGYRLVNTLDKAHFNYTPEDFEEDMIVLDEIINQDSNQTTDPADTATHTTNSDHSQSETIKDKAAVLAHIDKVKQMFDDGVLSEDEYKSLKASFIAELNAQ